MPCHFNVEAKLKHSAFLVKEVTPLCLIVLNYHGTVSDLGAPGEKNRFQILDFFFFFCFQNVSLISVHYLY